MKSYVLTVTFIQANYVRSIKTMFHVEQTCLINNWTTHIHKKNQANINSFRFNFVPLYQITIEYNYTIFLCPYLFFHQSQHGPDSLLTSADTCNVIKSVPFLNSFPIKNTSSTLQKQFLLMKRHRPYGRLSLRDSVTPPSFNAV